jgi:hypothetical protein
MFSTGPRPFLVRRRPAVKALAGFREQNASIIRHGPLAADSHADVIALAVHLAIGAGRDERDMLSPSRHGRCGEGVL